jgi:putative inorganic carbon (hco3(-)) transporter
MMEKLKRVLEKVVEIALYGLVFSIPFSKAAISIFSITAIIAWFLSKGIKLKNKELRLSNTWDFLRKNPAHMALAVFLTVNIISCITGVAIGHSLKAFFTKTLEYALFFIVVVDVFSDYKKLKRLLIVTLISVALAYINGIAQYIIGFDIARGFPLSNGAITGAFSNPNGFGNYVIMFIPILLGLSICKNILFRYRAIIFFMFSMSLFCMIFTYSRASVIGFSAAVLFFGFVKSKKLLFVFIIILLLGFFILPNRLHDQLKRTSNLETLQKEHRVSLYMSAINIVKNYPITGAGLNTYAMVIPKYAIDDSDRNHYAHNSYLQIAAETGIVGLMAFLWFLWAIFIKGMRHLRLLRSCGMSKSDIYNLILGLMAGIVGFSVHAFFDTTFTAVMLAALFWIMLGAVVAVSNINESCLADGAKP